jgi:hypothetical protein
MSRYLTRTGTIRVLRTLGFSFAAVACLSAGLCPTSADSPCGPIDQTDVGFGSAGLALTSSDLSTTFDGGVRTFSWSRLVEDVCAEAHASAHWTVSATDNQLPPGWKVEAGYLVTALLGSNVTLKESVSSNVRTYDAEAEIGLKQAYAGKPGRFVLYIEISFTSQGTLQTDREAAQRAIQTLQFRSIYRLTNPNK